MSPTNFILCLLVSALLIPRSRADCCCINAFKNASDVVTTFGGSVLGAIHKFLPDLIDAADAFQKGIAKAGEGSSSDCPKPSSQKKKAKKQE